MFEVPVFVASLTEPLFIFVFDYDQKKKKTATHCNHKQKTLILCQNKTNLITLNVKKRISFLPIAIKFYASWWPLNI